MDMLWWLVDFVLHIDTHLDLLLLNYGTQIYFILFLIVFCETGLVVTPVLPGDSLLFAAGALAARGSLDATWLFSLLVFAAILGDATNYSLGKLLGPKVLERDRWPFRKKYLEKTERFYARYGGKTIIFARFVPFVRTFAPFLAGVGTMSYSRFALFNVVGAVLWVGIFLGAGLVFGEIESVRKNFTLVIFGIILVSLLPAIFEFVRSRREAMDAKIA